MTLLNDWMTNYELDPALAIPSLVGALSLVLAIVALWAFVRTRHLLRVLPALEERAAVLNHSMALLTDTTESCFKALAMQLQFVQSQSIRPTAAPAAARARNSGAGEPQTDAAVRKSRQRRVVGAARRGEALSDIAAREDVAEGEVALRLHVNRDTVTQTPEAKRHGSLLS